MRVVRQSSDGEIKIATIFDKPLFSKLAPKKCKTLFVLQLSILTDQQMNILDSKNLSERKRKIQLAEIAKRSRTHEISFKIMNPDACMLGEDTVTILKYSDDYQKNDDLFTELILLLRKNKLDDIYKLADGIDKF